jgi:hypothetical protein
LWILLDSYSTDGALISEDQVVGLKTMAHRIFLEKRRNEPRCPVCISAKIVALGHAAAVPCIITEISPTGARVDLSPDWAIPKTFGVRIDFDSCLHPCRLAWREGSAAGLEFPSGSDKTWWKRSQTFAQHKTETRAWFKAFLPF